MKIFWRILRLVIIQCFNIFVLLPNIPKVLNFISPGLINEQLFEKISSVIHSYKLPLLMALLFLSTLILLIKKEKENTLIRKSNNINSVELDTKIKDLIKKQINNRQKFSFQKVDKLEEIRIKQKIGIKDDNIDDNFDDCFNSFLTLYKNEQYAESIESLSRAIKINNNIPELYYNRALAYFANQDFINAVKNFNKAIALGFKSGVLYFDLAGAYFNQKKYKQAIESLTEALKFDSSNPNIFNNRGNLYSLSEKYNLALDDFDNSIKLDPENAIAYCNRGNLYFQLNEFSASIENYQKGIDLGVKNSQIYFNLAISYFYDKNYSESIKFFTKSISLGNDDYLVYYSRGSAYYKLTRFKAVEDFTKVINLGHVEWDVLLNRSKAFIMMDLFELAIDDLSRAIKINPAVTDIYTLRARTYLQNKDYDNAIKDYLQIIKLDNNNIGCYENLVELEIIRGNFEQSKAYVYRILHITNEYSHRLIGYFFLCINQIMLRNDIEEEYTNFKRLISDDIQITWDFTDLEYWFKNTQFESKKENSIKNLIEEFKTKTNN